MDPNAFDVGEPKRMSFHPSLRLRLDAAVTLRPEADDAEGVAPMEENVETIVEKRVVSIAGIIRTFPFGWEDTMGTMEDPLRRLMSKTPATEFYNLCE